MHKNDLTTAVMVAFSELTVDGALRIGHNNVEAVLCKHYTSILPIG